MEEEEEEEGEVIEDADASSPPKRRESPPSSSSASSSRNYDRETDRYRERSKERDGNNRDRDRFRGPDNREKEKERYSDRSRDYDGKRERENREMNRNDRERDYYRNDRDRNERERNERERLREEGRRKEEAEKKRKEEEELKKIEEEKRREEEYKLKVSQQLAQLKPTAESEEEEARKRRERRRQILEKHKHNQSEQSSENLEQKPIQETQPAQQEKIEVEVPKESKETNDEKVGQQDDMFGDEPTISEPVQVKGGINLLEKEKEKEEKHLDEFDMFGQSPMNENFEMKMQEANYSSAANHSEVTDDAEGYYCYSVGEVLKGKYRITGNFGKGVFSTVLRAVEIGSDRKVAVKILRNNDAMKRTGYKEVQFLNQLAKADPESKYTVKFLDHFEDRQHLCLVFESMEGGNLREVLKRFGTKVGLSMSAVRLYAHRLMLALRILKKCEFLHADIKPDNILVNAQKIVKLGDFGSGFPASENTITPELVSRFYRAPEITLGLRYEYGIDMWSVGCSLFEIATGSILFPGRNHNDLLYRHLEVTGPCPKRLMKKGLFVNEHFDSNGVFNRLITDKVTGKEFAKPTQILKPTRDIKKELLAVVETTEEKRMAVQLGDLLSKIFVMDPSLRITPEEALKHPFIVN
eukprot:TRINITY_DN3505_c3_g1_i5.p1 TRINITY_DN3505_c3_g1~~TRINITY_DN3505_c3_g1_i5.p1  ORF type:complete len:640 (+),score=297.15 TRINITY_DN3505_c3_g1_i5:166-2085(+)